MGLRNLSFQTAEVQTSGGPLAVRGLSLDHVLSVFYRHRAPLETVFNTVFEKARDGVSPSFTDMTMVAIELIGTVPVAVAEMITLAAGVSMADADFDEIVRTKTLALSFGEQIDALEKIAQQTFTSDMPPGKMLALLVKLTQAGSSAAQKHLRR